ncbi:MAG: MmgE/PrpD family protein [Boseongicola sp.]|nr:MAG: MmgE/PrpD family protein [Boseongicola sp.]
MFDQTATTNDFIHRLTPADVPDDVMHMARRCLLDTLGVWISGLSSKPSKIARNHVARRYPGEIPMPLDGRKVNPVGLAFAGAVTIDAIDGHDGHQLCKGHASVALVPALFAELGNAADGPLEALLTHLIVGEEIAIRAGLSLHSSVPDYHFSGAWNSLGCAAIAARLRGFSAYQTRQAIGIAEYFGPRAQMMRCIEFPTMVKDSSSWGAMTGISAADLAEDGFTGAPAITCESADVESFWTDLGQSWRILETNFKAYPVCRWAHPAIEGIGALMSGSDVPVDQIEEIIITTFREATKLDTRRPTDGDSAQYSLPLTVALAALHGTVLPEHVLPEVFDKPEVWQLVDKVRFAESEEYNAVFPGERFADVSVVLSDGQKKRSRRFAARGNHDAPLSDNELMDKFCHFTDRIVSKSAQEKFVKILSDPANAPSAAEVVALMRT